MKGRVLIVDDDPAVRSSLRRVLKGAGYEAAATPDGEGAATRFATGKFDLVLLDLNLSRETGWDVFERLTTQFPLVRIIIITGMTGQFRMALAAGADALLEKPIEVPTLLKTMEELLAEPAEARLRRMCGYQDDTRYVPTQRWGINE